MRQIALLAATLLIAMPAAAKTERRCGWYQNPTPGNVVLVDADGLWWLSRQGGPTAPGFDEAYTPAFDDRLRIDYAGEVTNRYGYSCACADGEFDSQAPGFENVRSISRLVEIPMSRCEQDPALPPP